MSTIEDLMSSVFWSGPLPSQHDGETRRLDPCHSLARRGVYPCRGVKVSAGFELVAHVLGVGLSGLASTRRWRDRDCVWDRPGRFPRAARCGLCAHHDHGGRRCHASFARRTAARHPERGAVGAARDTYLEESVILKPKSESDGASCRLLARAQVPYSCQEISKKCRPRRPNSTDWAIGA